MDGTALSISASADQAGVFENLEVLRYGLDGHVVRFGKLVHSGVAIATATTALYFAGVYLTYLSTPWDLDFQLSTSATRLMSTAMMALLVAVFFLLESFEAEHG